MSTLSVLNPATETTVKEIELYDLAVSRKGY